VIPGDVAAGVAELKQEPGRGISVNGSATLVRSLLSAGLIDELRLFVMPVLVRSGAQFPQGTTRSRWS
jgi:dihydrofolate reductase